MATIANDYIRLLGPVEMAIGGSALQFARPQHLDLLVLLLLHNDRMLDTDRIVVDMWADVPPSTAPKQVSNMFAALSRMLAGEGALSLRRYRNGYLAQVADGIVDVTVFDALVERARTAVAAGTQLSLLREALQLWRGPALGGVRAPYAAAARESLSERRAAATEEMFEAELSMGGHAHLVAQLTDQLAANPYRERLIGQLMVALYRSGRQHDALAVYRQARQALTRELGLEPGLPLQQLELRILRGDPDLTMPTAPPQEVLIREAEATPPGAVVPHQLPAGYRHFVGRAAEHKELNRLLDHAAPQGVVAMAVIAGTAGIGKTATAVQWAHHVAARFPDGQLYMNLRGFDPTGAPATPQEAIRHFLDAFGVPPERMPASADAQASLYRELLAARQVLVVLDNARDADQVRPLLPHGPGCVVLVTSRHRLAGLLAAEGAHLLTLDVFTDAEARELLTRHLGPQRIAEDAAAVDELILRCARLPLALAIVAARAAAHPRFPLAAFAAELAGAPSNLDALDGGDRTTRIRAVFSSSYHSLSDSAAALFRLIGLHPGPDIDAAALASMGARPMGSTSPSLAELTRAHLIVEHLPGRYTVHDLLRAYATDLALTVDTEAERHASRHRMFDHYLHSAHTATLQLDRHKETITLAPHQDGVTPVRLDGHDQALAWFTKEHQVLIGITEHAAQTGFDSYVGQYAWTLQAYLHWQGHWREWTQTQNAALRAAANLADRAGQAGAHRQLARTHAMVGSYDAALAHVGQALDLYDALGDHLCKAHCHMDFARIADQQGSQAKLLQHAEHALELYQRSGYGRGEASALNAIGWHHTQHGNHQLALTYCTQALAMAKDLSHPQLEANALDSLGHIHRHLGDHQTAIDLYRQAVNCHRTLGIRSSEAEVLIHLGDTYHAAGNGRAGQSAWQDALVILDELHHPEAALVRTKLARGRP